MKNHILNIGLIAGAILLFNACSDDDNDSKNGGTPIVRYIRTCDELKSDSLLNSAYLGAKIAIIGENMGSVNKIMFNDRKAKLNPSFVTNNAIIVDIPNEIPGLKEDLIRLYTNNDSCEFTFETKVPVPAATAMTCEYVKAGDMAQIQGMYFVNDEAVPLKVVFPGGAEAEIVSQDVNNVSVIVPENATKGPIEIISVYGTGKSSFHFRDDRNLILDFDRIYPDGGYHHGWHKGYGYGTENGVNGQYLIFHGEMDDEKWDDSNFGYERWTYRQDDPDFVDAGNLKDYVLKFEVNVPDVWSSSAFQFIFTGAEEVWMNWQETSNGGNPNNGYAASATYPRALWMPWSVTGSYSTNGWITVTIPMTDFRFNAAGEDLKSPMGIGHYSGLSLLVNGTGGVTGTPCNPTFYVDNVRVVEK
ncbi:MAG: glycan-binding surface protein [Bacteroidales bacterium]